MNIYDQSLQSADKEAANKFDNILPFKTLSQINQ
jgi:hypothetical protein